MTRVLLVDDNERQRKLSRAFLEDAGYSVDDASNAFDALDVARTTHPAVIVSDVMMDQVDGFGLCRRLKNDTKLASIPIVLVSAHYDDDSARELAKTLGASALIGRTPDFSAEMKGIADCLTQCARHQGHSRREGYEAHLKTNAKQLTKLLDESRRAELRWRTVFENAYDTLSLVSPAGVILEVNRRWEEVLGIPPSEMIGHHISEFSPPEMLADNNSTFQALVDRGSLQVIVPLQHASGSIVYMEFASRVMDVDGSPHVIAIGRDVTQKVEAERRFAAAEIERRQLEERLAHAQRLDTIGHLTGGIAHDFNNILCSILANADFLISDLAEADPRRVDAQEIREAAQRAADLAKRLLAFGRRQELELADVDVGSVVRSVSRMLKRLLGSRIDLEIEEHAGLAMVRADVVQLEQVIVNLAVNARDAMPMGGRLVIETLAVRVDEGGEVHAGDYVVLSVGDTGCGMSDETLRRLFEPFFTTKERGYGTGLGLSTSFGIVKQLGGEIIVSSALGHGTTMKVYLPRIDAKSPTAPLPVFRRKRTTSWRIEAMPSTPTSASR